MVYCVSCYSKINKIIIQVCDLTFQQIWQFHDSLIKAADNDTLTQKRVEQS